MYEVLAIRYGTRETRKGECFLDFASYGEPDAPLQMDYFFWLLRGDGRTILVDTGFSPEVGERRGRTVLCPPLEALARLGVAPADVAQVILTHLHYDHTGNVAAFPDAELVVQRAELDFWTGVEGRAPEHAAHVEPEEIAVVSTASRLRVLDGSGQVEPGIDAVLIGGHSPGQQSLVVTTERGTVVLASDAAHYYEEVERDRPFAIVVDVETMRRGLATLRDLAARPGAVLVPGHDPEVMKRFPVVAEDLAVRVG